MHQARHNDLVAMTRLSKRILLLVSLSLVCSVCLSQNISSEHLTWEAVEATDLQAASTVAMKCLFKTNANKTVEWIQKKGEKTSLYTVTAVEGSWPNVAKTGTITYALERNGNPCKMIIDKSASDIFITMDFSKQGQYTSRLRFKIVSVK